MSTATKCECGVCGWSGPESALRCELLAVPDLAERLDPGSEVPAGECPDCGALAYILKEELKINPAFHPYLEQVLVCSTAHVELAEAKQLDQGYARGEWGWLVPLGDFEPLPELKTKSAGLLQVLDLAKRAGCAFILFDRDADKVPGFTVYDW